MIDLTNQRFGKLTVIRLDGKDHRHECKWLCKCDCGNETVVYGSHLRKGDTVSCGCVMRNVSRTHGLSKTRLYNIWQHMKYRCDNPKTDHYDCYGGRGITYCDEWKDFSVFKDWALENGYTDELTIDRINVNGNYEPNNCRWATRKQQGENTRKTHLITHNGETHSLREWGRILGIPKSTIQARYQKGVNIFE